MWDDKPIRTWRMIAAELSEETSLERIVELSAELNKALAATDREYVKQRLAEEEARLRSRLKP
jgi:hypothetical protein